MRKGKPMQKKAEPKEIESLGADNQNQARFTAKLFIYGNQYNPFIGLSKCVVIFFFTWDCKSPQ